MPRLARLGLCAEASARTYAPGVLHHVVGWGIERKEIFVNDLDRNYFIDQKFRGLVGGVGAQEPG